MPQIKEKTKGILCIIIATFGFSGMSLFVKLAGNVPPIQKAFFRNFIALIFITVILFREGAGFKPNKKSIPSLFGRCFFGTVGLLCNFYAIGYLNLPDANMLNKLSPFFAILFSIFLLREKPTFVQVIGVIVAFVGSVFIIKPGFQNAPIIPAVAGAVGGMGAGLAYTFVRKLGQMGENGRRIIFYFSLFSCLVCIPFIAVNYSPMSLIQTLYLMLAGTFGCIGQLGITKAYLYAPAKEISVYDYTQVVFAALLGFIVFGELPDLFSVIGYIFIIGAGVAMFLYNKERAKI